MIEISLLVGLTGYSLGILLPLLAHRRPALQNWVAHGAAFWGAIGGVGLGAVGLTAEVPYHASFPSSLPLLNYAIRLDPLAAFFVLLISLCGATVSIYALGYVRELYGRYSIGALGSLFNAFLLSMTLVVLADDGFFFLLVWELMSLSSYFLVVTEHDKAEVRHAGFFYLIMTHVGTAFILLMFLVFFREAGSFSFEAFRQSASPLPEDIRTLAFLTALIGFGAKAGIVPLHVWLPYAHPAAPSHVSSLLSGVMIKTAIYGIVRVYFDFLGGEFPWWWGFVVLTLGAASALLGVMYALMEHDLKSLLAYHSVENIGIILLGIGAGMIFQSYGLESLAALGLLAGLYHTINHAVFKGLLFMGAGALLSATHTRNMEEYGGLIRKMPWTALFFLIGAVSISALPPSNGFVSEWLTFQSLFLSFQIPDILTKIMLPIGASMLALTGVLALACFAKAFGISFLAMPRSRHAKQSREVSPAMRVGMGGMTLLCVALGLAPMLVVPAIDRITASLTGVSIAGDLLSKGGLALTPTMGEEFASVSTPILGVLLAVIIPAALMGAVILGGTLRKRIYKTWGCGLNVTPRMEYTATAFVQPIKRVFSTVYQPMVKLETEFLEESRYFAKHRRFAVHIEPVFQKYLYDPVITFVSAVADRLRIVQAGSLHLYLTYIFITLILLLLFTV